jgi:hypothetical protein
VLSRAANRLRGAAGKQLDDLRKEYDRRAQNHEPVAELHQAITEAGKNLVKWADTGFEMSSKREWLTVVEGWMAVDPGETRDDQCTLARQKIREEFGQIDSSLTTAVGSLHKEVAKVLRGHLTPRLVPDERPLESLLETARQHRLATLCSALEELLEFRDSYGSIFLRVGGPIVRQIRPIGARVPDGHGTPGPANGQADRQPDGKGNAYVKIAEKGAKVIATHARAASTTHPVGAAAIAAVEVAAAVAPIVVGLIWPAHDDSAAGLYDALSTAFGNAVEQIEERMQQEAGQLAEVLAASMSQFFDRFARTPDVEAEWTKLCQPFQRELWPQTFGGGAADLRAELRQLAETVSRSDAAARDFLTATASIGPADARR